MDHNARFYSLTLGRFIQPDTVIPGLINSQVWNRYAYVMNSPIMYNDPSGHMVDNNGSYNPWKHTVRDDNGNVIHLSGSGGVLGGAAATGWDAIETFVAVEKGKQYKFYCKVCGSPYGLPRYYPSLRNEPYPLNEVVVSSGTYQDLLNTGQLKPHSVFDITYYDSIED